MSRLTTIQRRPKQARPAPELVWRDAIDDHVQALAWSPDGANLAAASIDGRITVYGRDGVRRLDFVAHEFGTTEMVWSPHSSVLASAGQDGYGRLWDAETGDMRAELPGGSAWVESIAWCPTRPILATAAGKRLRIWSDSGALLREFADHPSTIADIAWKPGGTEIAAAAYGGLTIWSPDAAEPLVRHQWQGSTLVIAWSPDGKYIATGDQDATVHFWIASTGDDLQMWGYETKVRELAWDSASRFLATGGGSVIVVWDCSGKGPEGTKPIMLDGHEGPITTLAYQHEGLMLASGSSDGRVCLWRPGAGRRVQGTVDVGEPLSLVTWSRDDRLLAFGTESGDVGVISL